MKKRILAGILFVLLLIPSWTAHTHAECAHTNVEIKLIEESDKSADELEHIHTIVYSIVCTDCGEVVEAESKREKAEPHRYDEDFYCEVCEYRHDGCPHVERTVGPLADVARVYNGNAETHHTTEKYSYTCEVCEVTPEDDFIVKEFDEAHLFQNDICSLCGFERDCTHEKQSEPELILTKYAECDDEDHLRLDTYIVRCLKCGIVVSEYADEGGFIPEAHDFSNNGLCLCGMDEKDKLCPHAETAESVSAESYERIFGDTVNHNHVVIYNVVCSDCGKILQAGKTRISAEEHTFRDGLCTVCKYVEACTHSRVNKFFSRTEYRIVEGDETKHQKLDWYARTCTSCGISLSEKKSSDGWQDEAHIFENGVCVSCGCARAVCPHAQIVKIEAGNYIEKIADQKASHMHIYTYNLVCAECGQVMQTGLTDRQTEPHIMQEDACILCGYADGCAHAQTVTGTAYTVYRITASGSHETSVITPTVCAVCGLQLAVSEQTKWVKGEHDYRNGVCACSARNGLSVRFPLFAVLSYGQELALEWNGGEGPYQLKFSVLSTSALYEASASQASATMGSDLIALGAHSLLITPVAGAVQKLYFVTRQACAHEASEIIYTNHTVLPDAGGLTHTASVYQTLRCNGCGHIQYRMTSETAGEPHEFISGICICGAAEQRLETPVMKVSASGNLAVYAMPGNCKGSGVLFRGTVAYVLASVGDYDYIAYTVGAETKYGYVPSVYLTDATSIY